MPGVPYVYPSSIRINQRVAQVLAKAKVGATRRSGQHKVQCTPAGMLMEIILIDFKI
jgi:hypothetical protein